MRSALALTILAFLFTAPIRAELVEATVTGHITGINDGPQAGTSFNGLSVGQKVQAFLRYDTHLPKSINVPTGPGGYGVTLLAGGMRFDPTDSFGITAVPLNAPPRGGGVRLRAGLYLGNWLSNAIYPGQRSGVGLDIYDPQGKLLGAAEASANVSLPGPDALAAYSRQVDAFMSPFIITDHGTSLNIDIAVDSIAVNQAPEPSALVLFGLGGLGLLGMARRRLAVGLLQ